MSASNVLWGAPRLHGELLKLGIEVSQATVAKYMVKHRKPPSQTWRTFSRKPRKPLISVDFFVVPTLTFRMLYVFVVLAHDRRRVLHFNVTDHPTAEWTATQLVQAFPWDKAPRYLLLILTPQPSAGTNNYKSGIGNFLFDLLKGFKQVVQAFSFL
jgi:hypothetical protein